ncbi:carboxypeptidase-like regulatory domain-containing protein [Saccharothrix syringae]|uniref:Carboxypeptidase regulatory-like domain-containing protein n=1 Tax=Saccharothrix syringae TaxID=103733 RepID=A0A5Q0GYU4_SACSY|nr:carboxypeptidase-like regulatory domain-containing protein [Saccharothrix syringae]QFZ19098.1 carboxypeptidase regulatory-like domain-containing protein [Saccharothrix syringae]
MTTRTAPVLLVALLAACGTSGDPPGSGVDGRTVVDGGCPPARDAPPCPDEPLSARIRVTRTGSGDTAAEATSDVDGRFRIPLPPGRYTLHPANLTGSLLPAAQPLDVDVTAGGYTTVTVFFDSGVR